MWWNGETPSEMEGDSFEHKEVTLSQSVTKSSTLISKSQSKFQFILFWEHDVIILWKTNVENL